MNSLNISPLLIGGGVFVTMAISGVIGLSLRNKLNDNVNEKLVDVLKITIDEYIQKLTEKKSSLMNSYVLTTRGYQSGDVSILNSRVELINDEIEMFENGFDYSDLKNDAKNIIDKCFIGKLNALLSDNSNNNLSSIANTITFCNKQIDFYKKIKNEK